MPQRAPSRRSARVVLLCGTERIRSVPHIRPLGCRHPREARGTTLSPPGTAPYGGAVSEDRGVSTAGTMWARSEVRRRPVALVALGLLAGLAAALAMAAVAGARRTDDAYARLRHQTLAADAVVFASQVGIHAPDWSEVAKLPYLRAAGAFGLPAVQVVRAPKGVDAASSGVFSVAFGSWRTDVDRPLLVAGRLPDPDDAHEVLATVQTGDLGVRVGDTFVLRRPSAEQVAQGDIWSEPKGDEITVRVVGIGRSQFETAIIPDDEPNGAGLFATPAFHRDFAKDVTLVDNLLVRFKPGQHDVPRLEADVRRIFDTPEMPIEDAVAVSKRVTNGTELETRGLLLFGLAVALAGVVLVGQALTRSVRAGSAELGALQALGFTRRDGARALSLPHLLPIAVAAVVAVGGAAAMSIAFPIGLGRTVDPDVGFHADWPILLVGAGVLVVALATTVAVTAWREAGRRGRAEAVADSRLVRRLRRTGAPVVVTTGAQMALEPGRGRRALPTRPALAGAVIGILGIVGAFTLSAGIDDALANPARIGSTWDVEVGANDPSALATFPEAEGKVDASDDVAASAGVFRALLVIDRVTQPTYSLVHRKGRLDFTMLEGRPPTRTGEIALGPQTAEAYGVRVGGHVSVRPQTGGDPVRLRVVGIVLLPTTPHSSFDQGAFVSDPQLRRLIRPDGDPSNPLSIPALPEQLVRLHTGVDVAAATRRLDRAVEPLAGATTRTIPTDLVSLRNVRVLPILFGAFTILLAIGTLAHVSASVVRRRAGDLAVLRVLGLTPRQTRFALSWQATTVAAIGLVIGLPLGLVLGRVGWRSVAESTPMLYVAPIGLTAVLLVIPGALLVANLLSWWPGRRAARLRPAEVLRTE